MTTVLAGKLSFNGVRASRQNDLFAFYSSHLFAKVSLYGFAKGTQWRARMCNTYYRVLFFPLLISKAFNLELSQIFIFFGTVGCGGSWHGREIHILVLVCHFFRWRRSKIIPLDIDPKNEDSHRLKSKWWSFILSPFICCPLHFLVCFLRICKLF